MASNYDIAFLRVLMQQSLADKAQALRCIQVIDEQAQRGQAVTAQQVVVRLGLVDATQAERVDGVTREELQRLGAPGGNLATTSFRGRIMDSAVQSGVMQSGAALRIPGPPPPLPGQPGGPPPSPSGTFARPPVQQSGVHLQGTLAPGYLIQPRPAAATPPSGVLQSSPPPARPASAPPAIAAPATAPPGARASGRFGNGVLPGEDTRAGDLERPASGSGASDDGYYDLAENGQGLDGYASGPKIGRGAVGTSYVGRRKADGAAVVVKVLSRRFSQHPDLLAQVLEDVGAWSGFRHPNLASSLAVGISNERHVIVFEQARGVTLEEHLRDKGRLDPRAALRVIYDLAQTLAAAQERGLSHGDVRAAKVHFDGQRGMLADPGLARASCLAAGLGQHGLCFGHPTYLAPEVLQERLERPTTATDVYAMGMLFYELVCGVPPFKGEVVEVLGKHFDAPLPPPPQGVSFSGAVAGLMLRMTAKGPSHRLPDAKGVVAAITNLLEGKPLGPMPGAKPAQKPHPAGISQDEWGKSARKDDYKGTSNNWTVSKIEQAPVVGPTDLGEIGPLTSEVSTSGLRTGAASTTGRLSRELVDEAAAIAQSPGGPRVGEKLGRGTVGTTYEGGLPGHQGQVVVKVVSKKFGKHPELVRRIMEGVRASSAMNPASVVRAVKTFQVAGRDMIVFERAPGRTLREALKAGPLPWRQATSLITDLTRTLDAARRAGVSHGDVRPEKIFVDEGGKARLADFGLAEAAALGAGFGAAGVAFGHPAYLAPEVVQERKKEPDERSDVYALGILYYELLCGKPPFTSSEAKRLLVMHLESTIPPPPDTITVPSAVAELILRMTTKDPTRRPASFGDLLLRLNEASDASSRDQGEVADLALPPSASDRSSSGLFGTSSEGRVSGEGPLGYKSADDDVVSPEAWGDQSLDLSKPSGEWTKSKIAQAPKVGPEEWTPEASGEPDEQSEPARKLATVPAPGKGAPKPGPFLATAQINKDELAAAIAQAAATKESTPEGPAATPDLLKDPKGTSKKQARAGTTSVRGAKASAPAAGKEGGSKKQLYLAVGGILVVIVVIGGVMLGGGNGKTKKPPTTETTPVGPPPPVVPPEDPEIKRREALLKQLEVEVKRAEDDVEEDLKSQRFNAANERVRNLSAEARAEPVYQTRILALETKIRQGATERLATVLTDIDRLVGQHQFSQAQAAAQGVASWAPDRKTVDVAVARVKEQIQAYHRPVAELALPDAIDPSAIEGLLQERLQGWRPDGQLFAKGGVAVEWRDPAILLEDLQVVRGKAPVVEAGPDGKPALRITAAKDSPTFVVIKLPMKRLVDATLDFVMTIPAGPNGQMALVMGARPPQPRGYGVSWGVVPVEVKSATELGNRRTMQAPALPVGKPLRARLSTTADTRSLQGTLWIEGQAQPVGPAVPTELSTTAGHLGLWVVDAEVWITGIEVRGLVDPAGLSR